MLFKRFYRILKANLLSKEPQAQTNQNDYTHSYSYSGNKQQSHQQAEPSATQKQEKAYYQALEVNPGASFNEIKASYKKLVKKYHPDLFHNNPEKRRYAETVTQKINEAFAYFEQRNNG